MANPIAEPSFVAITCWEGGKFSLIKAQTSFNKLSGTPVTKLISELLNL